MAFSLTWLPKILLDAGLKVAEQPGWQNRGRGDVGPIKGVICHHTAGPQTGNMPSLGVVTNGRPDLPGPLAQLSLGRDGTFFVVAAGRCNHAGVGNWKGFTSGNTNFIGMKPRTPASRVNQSRSLAGRPNGRLPPGRRGDPHEDTSQRHHVLWDKEYALPRRKNDPTFDMNIFACRSARSWLGPRHIPP